MARIRVLFIVALVLAGIGLATRGSGPISAQISGTSVKPPITKSQQSVPATKKTSTDPGIGRWTSLDKKIKNLDSSDETGLSDLYEEARQIIQADEATIGENLPRSMPELINSELMESFFKVGAWIRYSHSPTLVLKALWSYQPPIDPPSDPHHEISTPATRHERLQAYALKELRKQLELKRVSLSDAEKKELVGNLVSRATREVSMNLSLEMFQLLNTLDEPGAIQTALAQYSARDQNFIREVLASP